MCEDAESQHGVSFDARLATEGHLAHIFRIFTSGPVNNLTYLPVTAEWEAVTLKATVGGKEDQLDNPNAAGVLGASVVFEGRKELDMGKKWLSIGATQEGGGTILAIILASLHAGNRTPLLLNVRSKAVINALTNDLQKLEDSGFMFAKNPGLLRVVIGRLRMSHIPPVLCDKTNNPPTNLESAVTGLAEAALNNEKPVLPPIPTELHVSGAKLSNMSQALAYKALRSKVPIPVRPRTVRMLEGIKLCVSQVNSNPLSSKQI